MCKTDSNNLNFVDVNIDPALRKHQSLVNPIASESQANPAQPHQQPSNRINRLIDQGWFNVLTIAVILILTSVVVGTMLAQNRKADQNHFKLLTTQIQAEIIRRVGVYRYGLMGTRSAFVASNHVERQEFRNLVFSRELKQEFPAATGIGFIEYVPLNQLDTFLTQTREDGMPDFQIRRLKKEISEPDYMIIKYIEPVEVNQQAVGLDIGSELNRREAATHALLTGEVSITRQITLVQASTEGAGFLILLPVYNTDSIPDTVSGRRTYIKGWVYMTILAERLFADIADKINGELQFAVFDDQTMADSQMLYNGLDTGDGQHPQTHPRDHLAHHLAIEIGGRQWYVHVEPTAQFQQSSHANAWWAGISGVILATLVSLLLYLQGSATRRARKMADDMTIDLQNNMIKLNDAMKEAEQARQQAEFANQHKSEFLATMSHEIRTPLNGILGMASVLGHSELSRDQRNHVNTIINSSDSLLTIINDILDFSKIEAGKLELEEVICCPKQIADDVINLLENLARQKKIMLDVDIQENVPRYIMGDPVRIRQIFLNLLNNAIKFTDKGYVKLRLSLDQQTDKKATLRCNVQDTGVGIDEQSRSKLFRKFSQADSSTTRKHGGTGLGLAISKRLVEMMHGQIGVVSEPGKGSTFWFTMQSPLPDAEQIKLVDDELQSMAILPMITLQQYNILVVDDNPINRMVAGKMLQMLKANVTLSEGANDAFTKTRDTQFHLVLMDCQMPEIDGFQATKMLREVCSRHATPRDVPIIALTANAMPEDRMHCMQAGMNDFLAKPIKLDQLQKTLEKWLVKPKIDAA